MIIEDNSNIKSCNSKDKFANLPTDYEKSLSNARGNDLWHNGNGPEVDQKATLPNSVRLPSSFNDSNLWLGFKNYLIGEGQRKHSIRNMAGYAKRYCQRLETKMRVYSQSLILTILEK